MSNTSNYSSPEVADLGTLVELTQASGVLGSEDGTGKTVQGGVDDLAEVSIGVLP